MLCFACMILPIISDVAVLARHFSFSCRQINSALDRCRAIQSQLGGTRPDEACTSELRTQELVPVVMYLVV